MRERKYTLLIVSLVLAGLAIWADLPGSKRIKLDLGPIKIDRDISIRQGLDLQGGLQVLLEADLPADSAVSKEAMEAARNIVENRVNALGVTEPLVQLQGDRRIIVELPGIQNPEDAIATFRQTGLLEFIDAGAQGLKVGTKVKTTFETSGTGSIITTATVTPTAVLTGTGALTPTAPAATLAPSSTPVPSAAPTVAVTGTPAVTATAVATATATVTPTGTVTPTEVIYQTVMTGKDLKSATIGFDSQGKPDIEFELSEDGAVIFADYTARNIKRYLAIVLDKTVISSPIINSAIPSGKGLIEGQFTLEEARSLSIQLKYGALPVPLKVVSNRTIGASLGKDSVQKSITAGLIGLAVVLAFMLFYYRLPGLLASLALVLYALLNMMIFKLVPVTLTLPGVAGFLLSTGMAVDANVLIFERMKEELRAGRSLSSSVKAGFERAWTSIRDSNLSTLLTCIILFAFGSNFGASIVKGFAITLGIGVLLSMFTAITVTRAFVEFTFGLLGEKPKDKPWLLGL
jgi:preprotein translocase subunit SecD